MCKSGSKGKGQKKNREKFSLCELPFGRRDAQRGRTNSALGIWEHPNPASSLLIDTAVERTPSLSVFVFLYKSL